jgi:hypothetical protein
LLEVNQMSGDTTEHGSGDHQNGAAISVPAVSAQSILDRLKERDREDQRMLAAIDARLAELHIEVGQLETAKAKLSGQPRVVTIQPVRPRTDDVVTDGAPPVAVSLRMRILHFLDAHGKPATTSEIAAGLSGSEELRVRQALYDMNSKSGTVDRVGPATWKITSKGRNALLEATTQP